jgi:tyrosyl-tRNA synthetase
MRSHALLEELEWRGLLYQQSEGLASALTAGRVTGYVGFDPTAPSLHVGNLVPVMGLVHLQLQGHLPIALVGGGTGLIGDPGGKASERPLLSVAAATENADAIGRQLARFLDFGGDARHALLVNNAEWLVRLPAIEFMRDVGKHFTVNYMLQKDSVKSRMDAGISYAEFSYLLLQAYDFLELHRRFGATLQLGGSDQWGNITAGIELIRRVAGAEAHALTLPLMMTSSGTKFGKTESGAVWLDPARTSPYQFYQYWVNTDDRDAAKYLRIFTLLSHPEVEGLECAVAERPEEREAQQALARDVTRRVHGDAALRAAEEVSAFYFGELDPRSLSESAFSLLRTEAPFVEVPESELRSREELAGGGLDVVKLLTVAGIAASNGAARRLLEQGGASINKRKLSGAERTVSLEESLLAGRHIIVSKGKRDYVLVRVGE